MRLLFLMRVVMLRSRRVVRRFFSLLMSTVIRLVLLIGFSVRKLLSLVLILLVSRD